MFFRKHFFSDAEKKSIEQAIIDAEAMTSGEIRVHIEAKCSLDPLKRATEVFYKLGMDKTTQANGVLIYIAHEDKKFAIAGDRGINSVVPENFWEDIKYRMREHFKKGEFFKGTVLAIGEVGEHLKKYFPHQRDQKNELPNEISEG
jgi:uncharacterized membrane protein